MRIAGPLHPTVVDAHPVHVFVPPRMHRIRGCACHIIPAQLDHSVADLYGQCRRGLGLGIGRAVGEEEEWSQDRQDGEEEKEYQALR